MGTSLGVLHAQSEKQLKTKIDRLFWTCCFKNVFVYHDVATADGVQRTAEDHEWLSSQFIELVIGRKSFTSPPELIVRLKGNKSCL